MENASYTLKTRMKTNFWYIRFDVTTIETEKGENKERERERVKWMEIHIFMDKNMDGIQCKEKKIDERVG